MQTPTHTHATAIQWHNKGLLLLGPSGSGKSSLALQLLLHGAQLVADDQVILSRRERQKENRLWATCPPTIAGMIEVWGHGPVILPPHQVMGEVSIDLVVDLTPPYCAERLPEEKTWSHSGIALPCVALDAFHVTTPAKILAILQGTSKITIP